MTRIDFRALIAATAPPPRGIYHRWPAAFRDQIREFVRGFHAGQYPGLSRRGASIVIAKATQQARVKTISMDAAIRLLDALAVEFAGHAKNRRPAR